MSRPQIRTNQLAFFWKCCLLLHGGHHAMNPIDSSTRPMAPISSQSKWKFGVRGAASWVQYEAPKHQSMAPTCAASSAWTRRSVWLPPAGEQGGYNFNEKLSHGGWLKTRPKSSLEWLNRSKFARQWEQSPGCAKATLSCSDATDERSWHT